MVYSSSGQLLSTSIWNDTQPNDDVYCVFCICMWFKCWCDGACKNFLYVNFEYTSLFKNVLIPGTDLIVIFPKPSY